MIRYPSPSVIPDTGDVARHLHRFSGARLSVIHDFWVGIMNWQHARWMEQQISVEQKSKRRKEKKR